MESLTTLGSEEVIQLHADVFNISWEQAADHLLGGGVEKLENALARGEPVEEIAAAIRRSLMPWE